MVCHNWALFAMEMVPCRNRSSEPSETDPILCPSISKDSYVGSESFSEIRRVGDAIENLEVDESTSLVATEQPQCRICLDPGGDDLIAPCHCKGTQKYVHRSCLDSWRSTKEGFAFSHCTECKAVFILRANVPPDRWWLRLKFQLLVLRDHILIFFIVQLVVAFLGMIVYRFYGDELREMFGYEKHPYGFYTMATQCVSSSNVKLPSIGHYFCGIAIRIFYSHNLWAAD